MESIVWVDSVRNPNGRRMRKVAVEHASLVGKRGDRSSDVLCRLAASVAVGLVPIRDPGLQVKRGRCRGREAE